MINTSNETNEGDHNEKLIITSQLGAQYDLTGMRGHADVVAEPEGYDARALITLTFGGSSCFGQVIPLGSYKDRSLANKIASELRCSLENETSYALPSEREENVFGQLSLCFQGSSMIITKQDGNKVNLKQYNGIMVIHDCALFPESEKGNPLFLLSTPSSIGINLYDGEQIREAQMRLTKRSSCEMQPEHVLGEYVPERAYIVGCALTEAIDKREPVFVMPKEQA